jgi:hypothetical protein
VVVVGPDIRELMKRDLTLIILKQAAITSPFDLQTFVAEEMSDKKNSTMEYISTPKGENSEGYIITQRKENGDILFYHLITFTPDNVLLYMTGGNTTLEVITETFNSLE